MHVMDCFFLGGCVKSREGCKNVDALNYDLTAESECINCCEYSISQEGEEQDNNDENLISYYNLLTDHSWSVVSTKTTILDCITNDVLSGPDTYNPQPNTLTYNFMNSGRLVINNSDPANLYTHEIDYTLNSEEDSLHLDGVSQYNTPIVYDYKILKFTEDTLKLFSTKDLCSSQSFLFSGYISQQELVLASQ